jgi:hypothetical protein
MIVVSFDVIANPSDELGSRQPNPAGRKLWNMMFMQNNGRICLLVDGVNKTQHETVMSWLKKEGYKPNSIDFSSESGVDHRLERIRAIYAGYGKLDYYVDIDPAVARLAIKEGICTILITDPHVIRPEWEKVKDIRQWDQLVEEIEHQTLRKAEKAWHD